jgi:hypothetical protein
MAALKDVTLKCLSVVDPDGNVIAENVTGPGAIKAAQAFLKPLVADNIYKVLGPKGNQRWTISLVQQVKP